MMFVHHICERTSLWNQRNLLVGGINVKDMMDYVVMVEVREYMESMELIKLMELVKRETID